MNASVHAHTCTLLQFFEKTWRTATSREASKKLELQKQVETDKQGSGSRQLTGMQAGGNESIHASIHEAFSVHVHIR